MTNLDPLTETRLTETLDKRGDLDDARGPGVYTLLLDHPPDDAMAVAHAWSDHFDALPKGEAFTQRLAAADRLVYVGSHHESMYRRLCQHVNAEQSSTIMQVWPPVDVWGIYPGADPDTDEYALSVALGQEDGLVTWQDGELFG